ncbi:TRAP transporter large permease [Pelagibacterium halotolerans]|uniref:TRAP transporter large permease protein n=1 Tax=Pelagibacterium halotolerans (strain DSM 22347 / JCM 15775 / CGMCC 1.7692 / B2) TaxID=1082931 RepID=G4RCC9_PELHB|nr:TRAP transporter large permease [Pelagibacterium halotolerans]AEQ53723.1 TRAP dicarboxylate transporter, DctM subunit, unknown substrate 3 [Pelagibacterium halotolerans B2]QJR20114.1 TRAP transporter large permease [Pelagibacterium halotolerans]SEA79610.1 TRAP transporter, DctM subunit [Pelagibacterium halotolerans]
MTSQLLVGLTGLTVLIGMIAIRIPIGYAMAAVGMGGVLILSGPAILLSQLKTLAYGTFSNYDLSVVPLFILMGHIATKAQLSQSLFRAANAWFGRLRGGVAMAAIAACAGFGAVCGSSLATASTMGKVALPELRRYKYSPALATGTLAAGGVLGILIPPSVVLVVYAVIVEANIVTMFSAALVPGLIAVVFFMIVIAIYTWLVPEAGPRGGQVSREELTRATIGVLPVVVVFGLVIGGIYAGLFTPTPAASIGVFLVLAYGVARRLVGWRDLLDSILETAKTAGMIYLIVLGAELLKIFMSRGGVPQAAADMMLNSGLEPMMILILLLVALIVLGCLMDSLSMILLAMPFFWPVIAQLDFGMTPDDTKVWFGILALIVVELGLITPPVGMNVFVINSMARDIPMWETFKGALPFFAAEIVRVALLLAFPAIVLFFPRLLG